MTLPDAPTRGRSLRSTITSDGRVRLSLEERPLPELGDGQVVVAVEASPINPSDLGVLLGPVRPDGLTRDGDDLVGSVPAELLPRVRDRLDKSLPVGNEGAGTVIAGVPELVGKRVALFGGSMWADYRVADAGAVVELPDDVSTAQGAALFVNPLTALAMVETMRAENHTALVHTAAASNLGQMLVKICADDGVPLVNIVRKPEQVELLKSIGAEHVADSSQPDFAEQLTEAIRADAGTRRGRGDDNVRVVVRRDDWPVGGARPPEARRLRASQHRREVPRRSLERPLSLRRRSAARGEGPVGQRARTRHHLRLLA